MHTTSPSGIAKSPPSRRNRTTRALAKALECPLAVLDSAPETAIVVKAMEMTAMQRRTYQKPTLSKRDSLPLVAANGPSKN
jgi:hypothetical protein